MAEKQIVQRSEELLRPETQSREDRDKDRVEQIQQTARDEVSQFDDWLDAADVGGTELFGIGSRFERRIMDRIPLVTALRTRNRIMKVIGDGAQEHQNQLAASGGEFSAVEQQIFANSRVNTMNSINHRGRGAHESLLVAETSEELMNHSLRAFDQQWNNAKASAEAYFSTRKWWEKGTTFWRKARFERFSRKFEAKLEEQKTRIQTGIDIVKNKKKADIERAENFLDRSFKNADDSQRERQWEAIKDVVETPANAAAAMAVFGFPPRLSQSDFLEALRSNRFDYVQGTVACRRSEHLNVDAEKKIEQLQERDVVLDAEPEFGELRARLIANAVKPETGTVLDTHKMAVAVEKEVLRIPGINLSNDVYGGNSVEGITAAEKMHYFSAFLDDTQIQTLDIKVRRQLLQYLEDLDTETENDFEDIDLQKKQDRNFANSLLELKKITGTRAGIAGNLSALILTAAGFDATEFDKTIARWDASKEKISRHKKIFDRNQEKLSEKDKKRLNLLWEDLLEAQQKIEPVVSAWRTDAEQLQRLTGGIKTGDPGGGPGDTNPLARADVWLADYRTKIAAEVALQRDPATLKPQVQASATRLAALEGERNQLQSARDALKGFVFTKPSVFGAGLDMAGLNFITSDAPTGQPTTNPTPGYNTRAQNRLRKEFNEDAEKDYLAFLQKNTEEQWQILQHVPKGARVSLDFRNVTNVNQLNMPADLQNNKEEVTQLRVIKKTETHVILEDTNNIYEISGASADGDKFRDNVAVYKKLDAAGNPDPNAPQNDMPFHTAKSTPNRTGTILSMYIS